MKLPIKWMALESILDGIFTEKTDVVSAHKLIYSYSQTKYLVIHVDEVDNNFTVEPSNKGYTQG